MSKKIVFTITVVLLCNLCVLAQQQPHNDPLAIISNRPRPNVLIMFDTSGSMLWDTQLSGSTELNVRGIARSYSLDRDSMNSFLIDSDNSSSRMGQAKDAMREMLSQIQDINVGLGRFKRVFKLNRFRANVPSNLVQQNNQNDDYNYYYWDSQAPDTGQINIPYRRRLKTGGSYEYPYLRTVRRDSNIYRSFDALDIVWSTSTDNYKYFSGDHYSRMNWSYSYVENARRQMFRALLDDGTFINRSSYSSPDSTHRNKLNQVDNIDIFLTDSEMVQLRENTTLGQPLTVQRYVESAYGVTIQQTLTFEHFPIIADWNNSINCEGEMLIDVQNRFEDDFDTFPDESDNKEDLIAVTGELDTNAKIYDFSVDPIELLNTGAFYGIGSTPLGKVLETARSYFTTTVLPRDVTNTVDHCRENFIILLTDGLETCGGAPETIAQDLWDTYGIKVYVVAFVTNPVQANGIASAGGTDEAFTADNKDELIEALQEIFAEIRTSVELAAPVAVTSSVAAGDIIEGNMTLLPFFDFPGFNGRIQARKIFKNSVVEVDVKTGEIKTDAEGDPVVIEDNISDDRILALVNDPDDPIEKDPSREIVGLQLDPPEFMWEAGELVSLPYIDDPSATYVYPHLKADSSDLDGDSNTSELIVNPAYKTADSRRMLTTLTFDTTGMTVVDFDTATLIDNGSNKTTAKTLLDVTGWSDDEARFLINYTRGKSIRRFTETTTLYGQTFNAGDPMPDPDSPDDDSNGVPDDFLYAEREWKKGDVISSTSILVRPPSGKYPIGIDDDGNTELDYDEFVTAHKDNPPIVVSGANDGMLHAYSLNGVDLNDDDDYDDPGEFYPGEEIWTFVLPDTMSKLKELFADSVDDDDVEPDGQKISPHQYFIDGQVTLSIVRARIHTGDTDGDGKSDDPEFRMIMLFGEGRGGSRYWCFDVTDPMNPAPVWSLTHSTMGFAMSRPAVGAIEVAPSSELDNDEFKYFTFFGSGYDYSQADGSATVGNVFYKVDVKDGTIVESFSVGDVAGGAGIPNAIVSRAILVDEEEDFFVERAYFADLDGNIWRWNFDDNSKTNLLATGVTDLVAQSDRLQRPIADSITYANIFGSHIITAATGGDTRRYLNADDSRKSYPTQMIYLIVDTDKEGNVRSLLNGVFTDEGVYADTGTTVGIEMADFMIAENLPVVTSFTEYDAEGKIFRGFQTFYPTYTPDPAGLKTIRCTFGNSDLLVLDSIFSETDIVSSTSGSIINMGEGKATGITYTGGNILFSLGDQFKIIGSGVYRFESSEPVKARLKVLSWKEVF